MALNGLYSPITSIYLDKIFFTFNDQLYLQIQGVAMRTSCAPAYANLFLGGWERSIQADEPYKEFLENVLLWFRYLDDLFLVWTGTKDNLLKFIQSLNDNNFNLKFTFNFDSDRVPFLDQSIAKQLDGTLGTDLYRKPTAGNTLLHASSSHPYHLVRSIPTAQYLRLRRNCTLESDFRIQANALRDRLLLRGYSSTSLRKAFNRSLSRSRNSLLYK